jgi:MFS family permease
MATSSNPADGLLAEGRWAVMLLISAGIWLHAADITVVATVMPDAVRELGGAAWIPWAWMLELVGAILAAASCGLLAARHGTGFAGALAGAAFALGCTVTALAGDMGGFLVGRLLQGLGGGAMMAISNIGISLAFPDRLWTRAYALLSLVWGASSLVGPLIGGLFAEAGFWQGAFWVFAAFGLLIAIASPLLLPARGDRFVGAGLPVMSLLTLLPAVLAIGFAGVIELWWTALLVALAGIVLLLLFLRIERRGPVTLLPRRSLASGRVQAGLLMAVLLGLSATSFPTYGPLLLERLHGLTPLEFGYLAALESIAWSAVAMLVVRLDPGTEPRCVRWGAVVVVLGIALFALTMPHGPLWGVVAAAALQAGGFGLCWSFVTKRIIAASRPEEREAAAGSVATVQMLGYALGAASVGIIANGLGFAGSAAGPADPATLESVALWLFVAFLPTGLLGVAAARRLAR